MMEDAQEWEHQEKLSGKENKNQEGIICHRVKD
jgi:hypothetical protein